MLLHCAIEGHKVTVKGWGNALGVEYIEKGLPSNVGGIKERIFYFLDFETNVS